MGPDQDIMKQQFMFVFLYDVETLSGMDAYRTRNVAHPQLVEFGAN